MRGRTKSMKDEPSFVKDRYASKPEERLTSSDIDKFCRMWKGDEDSDAMATIYENNVPKILYDTEIAVRSMRSKFGVDD